MVLSEYCPGEQHERFVELLRGADFDTMYALASDAHGRIPDGGWVTMPLPYTPSRALIAPWENSMRTNSCLALCIAVVVATGCTTTGEIQKEMRIPPEAKAALAGTLGPNLENWCLRVMYRVNDYGLYVENYAEARAVLGTCAGPDVTVDKISVKACLGGVSDIVNPCLNAASCSISDRVYGPGVRFINASAWASWHNVQLNASTAKSCIAP